MPAKVSYNRNFRLGTPKRILSRLRNPFILAVILFLAGNYLLAAEKGSVGAKPRFRVFALKHISAEQAKSFLAEAKLGTVSQLPTANMILVTGQPRQLIKASAVLKLFDAETPVVMKAILPASAAGSLPSNEQIAAEVGNMSIGSFSNPPSGIGKAKAIIDVHDDSVVAIAPADQLDKIIEAIGRYDSNGSIKKLQKGKYEALEPVQPKIDPVAEAELERVKGEFQKIKAELNGRNGSHVSTQVEADANDPETSGLFDKLLDSLDDAEKKIAELSPPAPNVPEPNKPPIQPGTIITPPEKKAPNEPPVVLEQPKEKVIEPVKEAEKPELAKPEPEKVFTKLPSKTDPNTVPEQVTVEVEEPNQIAPIKLEEPNTVTHVVVEPNKATKVIEPTAARGPYEPELVANGNDKLELDMPPKINIIDLLDLVGKYLNLDYMYDPVDLTGLKGEVTLVLQGPIKIKDLYPLAESVLRFKGYVMTRRGNLVTIVPIAKVKNIDAPIVDPKKPGIRAGDVIITRIFELEHIDTASAQNLLTAMKLGVTLSPIPDMGTIIITGYAYRMERIEALLKMIDKPGEKKQFRSRTLQYTMAQTLAAKVKTLAEQLGTVSITVAVPTPTTPARPATPRRPTPRPPTRPATPAAAPAKSTVYLDADERTNRILMIGLEEQLAVVDTLIDALDVEQQILRTLRLYEIQYVDAEEVRAKLSELGIISTGRTSAASSRATSRIQPTRPIPGRPTTIRPTTTTTTGTIQESLAEEPQIVIIEPTNSLLVNATAEQHVQIATIIGYVDSEQEVGRQNPYVIYPLENQEPEELAGVLEKLIQDTITEKSGTGADSKVVRTTTKKKIEDDIFIVPDPKSYSLIIYASKKNQQWLASLIKELDEYRPQVLLDVTLVEITRNDEFSYNLNLISSFPDLVNTSGAVSGTILEGLTSSDIISNLGSSGMDRFIDFKSDGGSGTAFYGDRHINLLLDLVQKKNYGRILARPKLLVNDNEEGTIKAEETTYVVRQESSIVPGTTTGTSTTVERTVFEDYSAGITLTITPHISKGKNLRLIVSLIRSDFRITEETITQGKPPDTVTSDVQTTVTVPDGTTIILGGLERISQSKGGTKVPILGDIPLIGGLFRSSANTDNQSRLYVFVKAYILRPGEEVTGASDIEVVSLKNRATFEKIEKEMQEYEDWPGIKPKPMDPLKILEADEDGAVSLRNRQVFDKSKKGTQEYEGISGTRPELMHPIQILKAD